MIRAPSEDSDQPGLSPSLIRVFAVHSGWSESSLCTKVILLVLSWGGSFMPSGLFYHCKLVKGGDLFQFEPAHNKNTKWRVPSQDSDQPVHPPSDQSSQYTQWVAEDPMFLHTDSEDSDQTGRIPRLIWVFAGRTCYSVGFVMLQLISMDILSLPSIQVRQLTAEQASLSLTWSETPKAGFSR